jgi:hypothetical protein
MHAEAFDTGYFSPRDVGPALRGGIPAPRSPTPNIAATPETSSFTGSTNRSPNSHGREGAYADPSVRSRSSAQLPCLPLVTAQTATGLIRRSLLRLG